MSIIKISNPILIPIVSNSDAIKIEIEVYLHKTLIGYLSFSIQRYHGLHYHHVLSNMTINNCISNGFIQYLSISLEPNHFLPQTYSHILHPLIDHEVLTLPTSQLIIDKILKKYSNLIYV